MKISKLKEKLLYCLLFAVIVLIWTVFPLVCPFRFFFKIPCPGCGLTRAFEALVHLNLKGAFKMNAMFWSIPVLVIFYFLDGKIFKAKWLNILVLVLIFLGFFINWLFKILA